MDHASSQKKALDRPLLQLTFDLECWDEGDWLQPYLRSAIDAQTTDADIIRELLPLLAKNDAHATFFVTQRFVDRHPEAVRSIAAQGHEIGTHGPAHVRLGLQSPEGFRQDLHRLHASLDALGIPTPKGYRAPHFSLNTATNWVLAILAEEGYLYDSSQFSAVGVEYGSSSTPNHTYSIPLSGGTLYEVPIPGIPLGVFRLPFAGGIYFRLLPGWLFLRLHLLLARWQTPHVYLHPHELSSITPQLTTGPKLRRFLKYFAVDKGFSRLLRLTKTFRCVPISATLFSHASPYFSWWTGHTTSSTHRSAS